MATERFTSEQKLLFEYMDYLLKLYHATKSLMKDDWEVEWYSCGASEILCSFFKKLLETSNISFTIGENFSLVFQYGSVEIQTTTISALSMMTLIDIFDALLKVIKAGETHIFEITEKQDSFITRFYFDKLRKEHDKDCERSIETLNALSSLFEENLSISDLQALVDLAHDEHNSIQAKLTEVQNDRHAISNTFYPAYTDAEFSFPKSRAATKKVLLSAARTGDVKIEQIDTYSKLTTYPVQLFSVRGLSQGAYSLIEKTNFLCHTDVLKTITLPKYISMLDDDIAVIAQKIIILFDIHFGGIERLKICPQCGKLMVEKKKGSKTFCSKRCGDLYRYRVSPDEIRKCLDKQNKWIRHRYEHNKLVQAELSKENVQKLKPYNIDRSACGDCEGPRKGGDCPKLRSQNPELFKVMNLTQENAASET